MEGLGWPSCPGPTTPNAGCSVPLQRTRKGVANAKSLDGGKGAAHSGFFFQFFLKSTEPNITTPLFPVSSSTSRALTRSFSLFPLLHIGPSRCTRLSASSPASAAKGFHPPWSEIYIVTAPLRDHWCSPYPSRPRIGGPPQVICMSATAGYPAVQAADAAQKFAQRFLAGWSRTRSAPGAASFCRRPVLSGFLVCEGQTPCLREVVVDKRECRGGAAGNNPSDSFASGRGARGAQAAANLAYLPAAAGLAGRRCGRQAPRHREEGGRPGELRPCFCPLG